MRPGHRSRLPEGRIDYKEFRKVNAEAARRFVIEYLKTNGNISLAARLFGINRVVVYDIIREVKGGDLRDRSRAPRRQPKKTPVVIVDNVIEVKNKTRLAPERLRHYLNQYEGMSIPPGTVRHIPRRNKQRINYHLPAS